MKIVCSYCKTKVDKLKRVEPDGTTYINCPVCKREMKAILSLKN